MSFMWLMKHLIFDSKDNRILGCECIFPETIFFEDGEPRVLIKTETKDFSLVKEESKQKLTLPRILKEFQNTFRKRKKDYKGLFRLKYKDAFRQISQENSEIVDSEAQAA